MQIQPIRIIFIIIFGITANYLHAQISLNGTVTDSLGKPLPSVSITLKKNNGILLAFAITGNTGVYKIQYDGAFIKDSLSIEANAISFRKQSQAVITATQTIHFILSESSITLPNVTVRTTPLNKEGDTLNYTVSSFSTNQDRTIGDVIKKLPGVEVNENGQILYGGKPINRFYIDGDNLLDGKYNIATKGIPPDMVARVQVLENHQPVSVLKDAVKSESAAMNLVLKDKARLKVLGTGDIAIGTPYVYNTSVNTMLFKKQVKFINYIKLNNTGVDPAFETINHSDYEYQPPPSLLSASTGISPDIPRKRWLFNNAGLINVNDLVNLKKELQLRINCYYLFDRQYQTSQLNSAFFLPADTVRYTEWQNNKFAIHSLNTQFTLTANRSDYYISNVTAIENTPSDITSSLQSTSNPTISQELSGTITHISNRFNIIKKAKNGNVWEGFSFFGNTRNPSSLQIKPGLHAAQLNNNIPFAGLIQDVAIPTFYTNDYIAYSVVTEKLQQNYKIGFDYQEQKLNSVLQAQQADGSEALVADSFRNNLDWERFKIYLQAAYTYSIGKFILRTLLPITYQDTRYKGRVFQNHLSNLPVSPRFSLKYKTGENVLYVDYNYGNYWANIDQVYDSYVMYNYRFFYTNGYLLNNAKVHTVSGSYIVKDILKVLFFSIGGSYSKSTNSTINNTQISAVGQQSKLIPFKNVSNSLLAYSTASKYIFSLSTTISTKLSWNRSVSNQLQNGDLLRMQNDIYTGNININTKFSYWLNMSYVGSYMTYNGRALNSKQLDSPDPRVKRWQHELNANFTFSNNFYGRLGCENSHYQIAGAATKSFTFLDAFFTYKFNKLKTDIEFSLSNIMGMTSFNTVLLSANNLADNSYQIRPRMAMVKFYFRF